MSQTRGTVRTLAELTVDELAALDVLNHELHRVEHWIRECAVRSLLAVRAANAAIGAARAAGTLDSSERTLMNARVLCVGQLSADNGVPSDNVVARLNAANLLDWDGMHVHARTVTADDDVLLNRCSLFNVLLDHVNGDWPTMRAVRRLELEMAVSARQSFDVSSRL